MGIATTCRSALLWNQVKVAKVTDLNLAVQRQALDETGIGECDGSYSSGRRDATATARILYDPANSATVSMINRIFEDDHSASDRITIESIRNTKQGTISANCVITSVGIPYPVGQLMAADISMQLSGKLEGLY